MTADEIAKLGTPLTDAYQFAVGNVEFIHADFSRRMEQDRAALMEALEALLSLRANECKLEDYIRVGEKARETLAAVRERKAEHV